MLAYDPKARIDCRSALKHAYLAEAPSSAVASGGVPTPGVDARRDEPESDRSGGVVSGGGGGGGGSSGGSENIDGANNTNNATVTVDAASNGSGGDSRNSNTNVHERQEPINGESS